MVHKVFGFVALPIFTIFAVNLTAKLNLPVNAAESTEKPNQTILLAQANNGKCPVNYAKAAFRNRTGKVAFFNQWTKPVTVVIYHPSNGKIFNRYTVPPQQNHILFNGFVGDDWGICFENLPNPTGFVNNLGQISEYNPNWQGSPLFMIQNPRIRW